LIPCTARMGETVSNALATGSGVFLATTPAALPAHVSPNHCFAELIDAVASGPAASPKTIGAVKALYDRITTGKINPITGDVTQAPLTVPEVDGFRRLFGNTAGEDAAAAGKLRSSIDGFLNKLDENSFLDGGPEAVGKLNAARATASRNFKLQTFSEAVKNADGNPNRIQKAAFNFLKDQDNLAGLGPEDISALQAVRDGTGTQRALQMLGKTGFDSNNVVGPLVGGALTAGALPVVGTVARYGNKLAVRGSAQKAIETLSKLTPKEIGKLPPEQARAYLQLTGPKPMGGGFVNGYERPPMAEGVIEMGGPNQLQLPAPGTTYKPSPRDITPEEVTRAQAQMRGGKLPVPPVNEAVIRPPVSQLGKITEGLGKARGREFNDLAQIFLDGDMSQNAFVSDAIKKYKLTPSQALSLAKELKTYGKK